MSKNARSRLWSRWLSRKPAAELPSRGLGMETLEDRLAPATFTWSGAGANPLWSTAANWQGNLGPAQLTYQGPTALTVTTVTPGQAGQNEVQTFLVPGEDGTFTLATNASLPITPAVGNRIDSNVPLSTLQGLFNAAYGVGNTALSFVTQPNGDRLFTVQFQGSLANTNVPQLSGVYTPTIDLVFPAGAARAATQNDLATGTVLNKITIQGQATVAGVPTPYSLAQAPDPAVNSVVLGTGSPASGNFTVASGSGTVVFALPITLAANGDQSILVGSSGTTLSITSAVTASALNNLNKDGDGRLVLAAANPNLLGGVKVNAGILQIGSTLSLGPAGGIETVVSSGAGLYLNSVAASGGQTTIGEQLRLNGGGFDPIQGALFLESGTATWSGQVILETGVTRPTQAGGPGTVIGAGLDPGGNVLTLTITGVVTDSGAGMGLIKEGAGEVKLAPTAANGNTYRGQTNINNGILTIAHSLALGDSRQSNPAAFQTPTAGTVVNVSPGRSGQLRIEAPAGGPAVKVVGEYLVLNGAGNDGRGSLYSTSGNNTWAGAVVLGSKEPDGRSVTIGVEAAVSPAAPSTLTISGVVSDPDSPNGNGTSTVVPYSLTKVRGGRLILTNANTYRGTTFINAGAIVIRDSQGLGPANGGFQGPPSTTVAAAPTGETIVSAGAALELDVEAAYAQSVVPRFDDLGRDTWADSVTNDAQRLTVSEKLTINGRGPGATQLGTGTTSGQSTGGTGALRSWTGINTWAAGITLSSGEAAIGVELDGSRASVSGTTSRVGHPLPDSSYFRDDYSLTIQDPATSGAIGISGGLGTDFVKVGQGHLILPQANPYFGRTLIEQGWVTVQNNRSLGDSNPNTSLGDTAQQPTVVSAGAALHIAPTQPNMPGSPPTITDLTILEENIVLEGLGLGSLPGQEQHPYPLINQKGALVNLGGNNTIAGDVGLVSTGYGTAAERGAGIGVERASVVESPIGSGNYVTQESTLTIAGDLSDGITYQPSFNNTTPVTATPGSPNPGELDATGTRVYKVNATRGRISVPYNFGNTAQRLQIYYPDNTSPANLIYDTGDVATGGAGGVTGVGLATVNFGSATSTAKTVVVVVTPGANAVNPVWQVGVANIANTPHGVVTQFPSSFVKLGSETLVLQGAGSESGNKNEIREGTLLLQNDTALGRATTGTEITQQVYDVTGTVVASGATLQLKGSVSPQEGGVEAGVHVQDERLTLNQYGVQIAVAGQPTARYRIAYGGRQTDLLQVPSGYTGAPGTYAAYLQNQINTKLPNIAGDLTAGVPGAVPADATASVTELTPGVYSITFGAARFNNFDFSALSAVIEPISLPTVTSLAEVRISGSNAPLNALSDDNSWRGPVTLNSGTRIEVQQDSRLALLGDILEGAAANAPGSDLVKRGLGDLMLGGLASNYRGVTYIDKGIVTAVSSRAFGNPSTGAYDPNLGAAPGGTAVKADAQLQIQGSVTIAGEGLAAEGDGAPVSPTIDSTIRWQNVGPGATNNGVAPPYNPTPPNLSAPTSGRIDSIATDPTDPRVIYVATAGGGAWKTKDGGLTWIPLFDTGVDAATNQPLAPANDAAGTLLPLSAMMFAGQIAVAPSNPQWVYYATGDSNAEYNGIPNPGQTDNYAGSGVYRSKDGGKTWTRLLKSDGTNPLYGQAVTKMIVDPLNEDRIYVASSTVRTAPITPAGVPPLPTSVLNGSINAATRAGVWRYTTPTSPTEEGWVNLTGRVSAQRQTKGQAPFDGTAPNPLGTTNPGPDDDFRIRFPTGAANDPAESATWSDIQLITRGRDPNDGHMQYTLYIALGESTQTYFFGANSQAIRNAIYRTDTPEITMADAAAPGPSWWLGKGTYFPLEWDPSRAYAPTPVDQRGGEFDVGVIPPPQPVFNPPWPGKYGYIKIAVASTADETFTLVGRWLRTTHANITLYVAGLWRDPYTLDSQNPRMPAPIDAQRGEIRDLLKSISNVVTPNIAGVSYTAVPAPTAPFGLATGSTYLTQRPATGRYNFTFALRDYNAQSIADNDPNELFIGGLDSLFRSVDGATSWQVVQPDAGGFAPAESHHAIAFDSSNRLLVGTDGGLWRWDRLRFSNLNSNLPVVQFASVDAHPIDFRQAVGGTTGNGTQVWNGNTLDGSTGPWARVDNVSTTSVTGQSGSVDGVVKYDPFNPSTIYAVRDGVLRRSDDGGATWAFSFSYTASLPLTPPGPLNTFPLIVDPVNPNRIVFGGGSNPGVLVESTDKGATRTPIPAPIAPTVIALAGYQGDFVADPNFTTVLPTLPNVKNPDTIYISDGSTIRVTKNRGVSWFTTNFVLPADAKIADLIVNPVNRDEVYAAVSIRPGGAGGRVWRSLDAGRTWTDLTGTFDPDATNAYVGPLPLIPTYKLALDPRTGTLYVGNDNGVWVLVDANATDPANVARTAVTGAGSVMHWKRFGDGMPNVPVRDLVVNQTNSTLTAATYGRGVFQLFLTDYAANSGAIRAVSGQSQWTGPVVLTGDVTISAVGTQKLQNGVSAALLDFGGTISDAAGGPFDITKIGRGTVIFSGANTYAGVTDVREGVLEVKDPNALGTAAGNTVIHYAAALQVRSDIELEPITINGDGIPFNGHFTGALRNISGNNTYNGPLTLGTETTTGAPQPDDSDLRQVTIGTDTGSSLRIGQNPTGQNPTAVGHVQSSTDKILTITFAGGSPAGANWGQVTAAGTVAGPLTAITMRQGAGAALPEVQQFAIPLTAGMVTFTSPERGAIGPFDPTSPTFAADVQAAFQAAYQAGNPTIAIAAEETRNGITKELTGILVLASANTDYLGLTQVYTGAVEVRDGLALGPVGSAPTTVSDGAAVWIANIAPNTPTVVTDESLFLTGAGTPTRMPGDDSNGIPTGALRNTGGNNTWNGPIQLTDIPNFAPLTNPEHQVTFGVRFAADVLSVGPAAGITEDYAASGQFGLIKIGPGALRLTTANQYTGVTNINEGTVRAANDQALGVNTTSSEVQTIRVFGGGAGAAGQYQLTVNGIPTGVLTNNPAGVSSTAAQVQAEIEKLIAGGAPADVLAPDVLVSSTPNASGNVYTVTFRGRYAGQNVPQLGSVNVASGITVTIATPQEGGLGTVVAAGATLELDNNGVGGPVTVSETLTINGQGVTDPDGYHYGALGNRGPNGSFNTYAGPVTFGSATSVGAQPGSELRVQGRVLGLALDPLPATTGPTVPATAELTKYGFGTVFFQGAKEYRGRTVVGEGALLVNDAGGLGVGRNEVQQIRVVGLLDQPANDAEKFTLTLFGETTDAITLFSDPTAAADELLAKLTSARPNSPTLNNGPILQPSDVTVTAVVTPPAGTETRGEVVFTVTFMGRYANTNVPLLSDVSPSTPQSNPAALVVNTAPQGAPGTNEKQTFTIPNQGGSFTLNGFATPARNFNVPLATLQADFNARFGVGNTVLTQTVLPGNTGRLIEVTYQGTLAGQNVAQLAGTFTPTLRVRVDGVDGVGSEAQVVDVRNAVGLQYRLSYTNPFTGQPVNGTRLLGSNSTDAEFASALLDPVALGGLGIGDGMVVTTTTPGQAPGTNEVQTFVIPNGSGFFSLVGRRPTGPDLKMGPFAFNASLATLQAAFDAAYGAGDTLLTESTLPDNGGRLITVSFRGSLSAVDVPQIRGIFNNVTVTRTTSPGGFQYLVQFTGTYGNVNVLPLTTTIVNGGANIVVTTLQDGYEGTVVTAGASLQTVNLPAISSEWVTLNGGGRSKVQTFDVARAGAGAGTYTLRYTDLATGLPVIGTRVLTVGDAAGTVASSTAAEFAAALTDPVSLGGLGLGAGNVSVTRADTPTGAVYTIVFTGALKDVPFSNVVRDTSTGVGTVGIAELEAGGGGALRMRDSTGNFTTVWGDPNSVSPLILGSSASIGVESSTDVLRLVLPTTDRNPYSAPTPVLGPTGVRGANQGFTLTKVGAGTLEFNAIGDNDYTGATLVNDGTLLLNHTGAGSHNAVRGTLVVGDGIDFGGPAAPLSQSAVVRLSNSDQIANASSVTVNADGLLDLHGWVDTIGALTVNGGVVDTQKPTVPAFPAVPAGVSVAGPELTTGTVTMNDGQFIVRGGDQAGTGPITATNTAEVVVDPNGGLTSGAIDLTGSSLSVGDNATTDTQGATITARRGPAPGSVRSTITTGSGATLTTVSGATRGAVTLIDSDLTAGANSQTLVGALTLSKDTTLPATGSTASFGTGATLDTGGADVTVNESDLSTGTGAVVNPTAPAGSLTATGTAGDRSTVTFGDGTSANFRSVVLTLADLDVGANATLATTGTTAPNLGVTLTDATADFAADATLTTAGGGLSLTRSVLTGAVGLDVNTQAVLLADNSTLVLGNGPSATLNTNGRTIVVSESTLTTGDGAVVNPTNPAGVLNATGSAARRSIVDLGPNSTSTFAATTLDQTTLSTGGGATLNAGPVTATNSTITTGGNSFTNTRSVGLTDTNLTFGANSTNVVTGDLTTFDTPATADDSDITFGTGSTTTVTGGVSATNAGLFLQATAAVATGTLALSEALADLRTNATLSVSGAVSVAATANGSATSGPGTLNLTGPAGSDQTVTVQDGGAAEDFTIGSGLTAANGQTVVKAGTGRLTLAPDVSGATLTTLLRVAAGDVQVNTLTGPVQVDAGGTVSGNGNTGAITVPSGASVATVSPGNDWGADRSGILTADGDVAFGPSSTLYLNIIGNATTGVGTQQPGTHYDQLYVNGNVTIATGATLTGLVDTTTVRLSNQFVVLRATGTITGRFAEAAGSPGFVFIDGYKFDITYTTDPGTNDSLVVLGKVKVNTTTTLTSSNAFSATSGSPSTIEQPVTFAATVTAEAGSRVPPPGTTFVQFYDGSGPGRVALGAPVPISAGGVATLTVRTLTAGTHTITADYIVDGNGIPDDDDFNPSTSNPLTQVVEQPAVSITAAPPTPAPISPANPSPASVGVNDTLQLTAAVTLERSAYTPTLTVTTPGGTVVYQQVLPTVARVQPLNSSQVMATWNGKYNVGPNAGQFVPDGDYRAVISILDEWDTTPLTPTATTAPVTVTVDNTNPTTTGGVDAPVVKPGNATTPPPAATLFTATVTDANLDTWKVTVTDASGATVKTFTGTFTVPGPTSQTLNVTWDGTADAGYPVDVTGFVAEGRYTLTLVTTDAGGNTNSGTPVVRTVYVINSEPSVTLLTGLGTAVGPTTYGDTVTLTAVVALPAFVQAADANTFLSGKPVTFDFPGTTQMTSNLAFDASLNRYQASVTVPLNLPAGTYSPITATFLQTAELPAAQATGSHTVNPATLRVTAVNANRPYAEANPDFDFVVNTADLKYGDPVTVVSGEPTTAATVSSNVGDYAITQGTVTALLNSNGVPNYAIQFTNGVLSITPVPLTIQVNDATRARFGQNPPFTASYSGFKLTDGPTVVNNLNLVTNAQMNSPVGTYSIFSATTPTATNYFPITVLPGTLTVTGSANVTVVGSGDGSPAQAAVLNPSGDPVQSFQFPASFNGGIRTASADFNKDGVADYVIGSGPNRVAFVQVIDGATGATLFQAFPFEDFAGGVFVAAGDMTGDGIAELVVTPDEGGGPRVVIYRGGDFSPLVSYFAIDDANFRGGVRPAVGDIDGDGFADLAVSAGFGGGPRISLWDGEKLGKLEFVNLTNDFFAFEDTLRNGAFVSIGDVNGDGLGDLIAGAGPGGGPRVKIYDGRSLLSVGGTSATVIANFFAGNVDNRGGVKVAAKNLDGDKFIDVVTGGGKGDRAVATAYRGSDLVANSPAALYEFDLDGTLNGVFVG